MGCLKYMYKHQRADQLKKPIVKATLLADRSVIEYITSYVQPEVQVDQIVQPPT